MSINSLENFSVGTFNLQGCSLKLRRWQLASDIGKYKISVCCLQETKSNYMEETINGINLKFLNPQNKHHGMGFSIKKELEPLLHRIWKVSEGICVLQLKTKPGIITIINTYKSHSLITQKDKTKAEDFYCSLHKTVEETKNSIMIFIGGDFNAKVGKKIYHDEKCCGQYSRGIRNENSSRLINSR